MVLESLDYEILEYVAAHGPVSRTAVEDHFKNRIDSISYRLNGLVMPLLNENIPDSLKGSFLRYKENVLIEHEHNIRISDYGRVVLENYQAQQIQQSKNVKIDRALRVIPITISLIALIKSFWPEITSIWRQLMQLLTP